MYKLIFALGCLCLVIAGGLAAYRRYCLMQVQVAEMVAAYQSAGVDSDVAFPACYREDPGGGARTLAVPDALGSD